MPIRKNPFSLYFPIKLGCLDLFVFLDENLLMENEECVSKPHSHHIYELRFVESGVCQQIINDTVYNARQNSLILIRPNEFHYQKYVEGMTSKQFGIRFQVAPPTTASPAYQSRAYQTLLQILSEIRCLSDKQETLVALFHRMQYEILKKPVGYIYTLQLLSTLIMTEFIRCSDQNVDPIFPPEDIKYRGLMFTKLEQFFSRKYASNVNIRDLADDIKFSERQTARVLLRVYGMTFSQKLIEIRLQNATYQLTYTDCSIEDIRKKCGFLHSGYFYTSFRKRYGMTPMEYRNKNRFSENLQKNNDNKSSN